MIRIYTKPKGQIPDYTAPVVLHDQTPSVEDFCNKIHKGLMAQFKHAWVWGSSVRHQPQKVRAPVPSSLCAYPLFLHANNLTSLPRYLSVPP
jgi:hypothetical protein